MTQVDGLIVDVVHSPTERAAVVSALAKACTGIRTVHAGGASSLCERRGVDFLWRARGRWWGMQRKELHDLLASFDDGRLAKEIAQMNASVAMPHLVIEGRIRATSDGMLLTDGWGRTVTMDGLRRRLYTIASMGVTVTYTTDIADTAAAIVSYADWTRTETHGTAANRPKPKSDWGKLSNRDYQAHLLQGLPDVGTKTAHAILDTLGRCPLRLDASEEELLSVPGIGKVTARKMLAVNDG